MNDDELPGMWEMADFAGGQDEVRPPATQPTVELVAMGSADPDADVWAYLDGVSAA